jgi:hypothetical protein
MRMRLSIIAICSGALLLGFSAAACNSDGEALSLEEYFERVDELDQERTDASDELDEGAAEIGDDDVDAIIDYFRSYVDVFEDFTDGMDDLDAPDEAADAHDEAVSNLRDGIDSLRDTLGEMEDVDSADDLFAIIEDADSSGLDAANAACVELIEIASDNGIEVDLNCEDE